MPSVRVTTIEIDLHPGEAFPPGLGAFLDQVTAPGAPREVVSAAPVALAEPERVTTIEIDLHPGEAFPPGLGAFLDQVTAPGAPREVVSAAPVALAEPEPVQKSPAKSGSGSATPGLSSGARTFSTPADLAPAAPARRAAPKKEPTLSKATPVMQAKRTGKDDPRRAKAKGLWQQRGRSVSEIGQELGLEPSTLYYWKSADDWGERGARTT